MGQGLLRKLAARDDVEIRVIVGRDAEHVRPILDELRLLQSTFRSSFDSLLTDPSIHSIWLTNPNSFHGPQALAAMKAGKHVFCEKPAATNYADFCAQIDVQQKNPQLISYVNYILYFDPLEQRLRQMIAGSAFGAVTQIQVNYRNQMNITGPKAWKLSKAMMGDAFGMAINHALSVMVLAMASQAKPTSVFATSAPAKVKPFEAEPIWTIQLTFDNGATGVCLGISNRATDTMRITTSRGPPALLFLIRVMPRPRRCATGRSGTPAANGFGRWIKRGVRRRVSMRWPGRPIPARRIARISFIIRRPPAWIIF